MKTVFKALHHFSSKRKLDYVVRSDEILRNPSGISKKQENFPVRFVNP